MLDPKVDVGRIGTSRLFVGIPELPRCGALPSLVEEDDDLRSVAIEPGGSALFSIPQPGDWRVLFLRETDTGDPSDPFESLSGSPATIHVEDAKVEQTFVVAPDFSESPQSR